MTRLESAVSPGAWHDPALHDALAQVSALRHENAVLGRHLAGAQARAAQQAAEHARAIASMRRQLARLRAAALRRGAEARALRDALQQFQRTFAPGLPTPGLQAAARRDPDLERTHP